MNEKNSPNYDPAPLDTSNIVIPEEIVQLCESLARNTHEHWAKERMKQGWMYGEQRDDEKKKHPCLVPYEELPESEKQYDRISAMETVRMIMKLGFQITKK